MACRKFRRDLARYRELTPAERQALDEHLRVCPRCRNALAAYARQDAFLGTLGAIQPSPGWARRVQERLQTAKKSPSISRPVWAKAWALAFLAILLLASSTLVVSAHALPGQPLYVLKRGQEELRLRLLPEGTPRAEYAQTLAERRREEAKRLIQKGGTAELTLEGPVEAMRDAWWRVGGVEVQVTGLVRPDPLPALGETVTLHVRIQGGHATALAVTRQASSHTPAERPLTPEETPSATPTPQGEEHTPAIASPSPTGLPPTPTLAASPSRAPANTPSFVPPGQLKKTPQPTAAPTREGESAPPHDEKGPSGDQGRGDAPRGRP